MFLRRATLSLLIIASIAIPVHAETSTITFLGAIKEDTCQVNVQRTTVSTDCPQTVKPSRVDIRQLSQRNEAAFKQGTMNITWLDNSKRKGIVTTTYR